MNIESYWPECIRAVKDLSKIAAAEDLELNRVRAFLERLVDRQLIETMDVDGLQRMESMLGITQSMEDLGERRTRIMTVVNRRLPYTINTFCRWLENIVGAGNYSLNLDAAGFKLDLLIMEAALGTLKNIKIEAGEMMPANMLFSVVGGYWCGCKTAVESDTSIRLLSGFYPRQNLKTLELDGSWKLDGVYRLNGYKTNSRIDLYPAAIKISGDAAEKIQIDNAAHIKTISIRHPKTGTKGTLLSDVKAAVGTKDALEVESGANAETRYKGEITIEKNLWHLNGAYKLDGAKKLNAAATNIKL